MHIQCTCKEDGRRLTQQQQQDKEADVVPSSAEYAFLGTGVAGPTEVWLDDVLIKGSGVQACYEAVSRDPRCERDYFTLQ